MKIVSWNVNGLRAVLTKGLVPYLEAESADVFCFQEIKATPEQVAGWTIPKGYRAFWNPARRKGYAGTLVLSRPEPDNVSEGIGEAEGDLEGRVQTLEYPGLYVVNVYTPNAKGDLSRLEYRTTVWDEAFREHCCRLAGKKPVLFCGDLNVAHREIDLANPRSNRRSAGFTDAERESFTRLLEAGFVDTFRSLHPEPHQYSWWSYRAGARQRNVGWRIDYVCVSQALQTSLRDGFIRQQVMGSDHCPVGLELDP
jgi:exodeoxyribonuclease-3